MDEFGAFFAHRPKVNTSWISWLSRQVVPRPRPFQAQSLVAIKTGGLVTRISTPEPSRTRPVIAASRRATLPRRGKRVRHPLAGCRPRPEPSPARASLERPWAPTDATARELVREPPLRHGARREEARIQMSGSRSTSAQPPRQLGSLASAGLTADATYRVSIRDTTRFIR